MSSSSPVSEAVLDAPYAAAPAPSEAARAFPIPQAPAERRESVDLLLPILTASVATHLLLIAFLGGGVPPPPVRFERAPVAPPPAAVIEQVKLEPEPPPPPQEPPKQDLAVPTPDAPEPAAPLDLPPLPPVQAIAAVPSSVPVAFGIEVKGPVRVVNDASQASGAVGGRRRPAEPISLDDGAARRNLLLPTVAYPLDARRRHVTGTVVVEFRTSPTGDIYDVRVRETSKSESLDRAALENLRQGRWTGEPGYYVKAYEFSLH